MDLLTDQLDVYKGPSPVHKAKHGVIQLLCDIETIHKKVHKLSKSDLEEFLDKCIAGKPVLLKDITSLVGKVEDTKAHLAKAKEAEEKRAERAAKREAKKAAPPTLPTITLNLNIQQGGTFTTTVGTVGNNATKPPRSYKKKGIPKNVRNQTWNQYIGKEKGEAPCYCCGITKIDKAAFEAGHVIPEVRGGSSTIENLRPICGECNRSMRDTDMTEYAMKYYKRKI